MWNVCARINQRKQPSRGHGRRSNLYWGLRQQFSNREQRRPRMACQLLIQRRRGPFCWEQCGKSKRRKLYISLYLYTPKTIIERLHYFYKTMHSAYTGMCNWCRAHARTRPRTCACDDTDTRRRMHNESRRANGFSHFGLFHRSQRSLYSSYILQKIFIF